MKFENKLEIIFEINFSEYYNTGVYTDSNENKNKLNINTYGGIHNNKKIGEVYILGSTLKGLFKENINKIFSSLKKGNLDNLFGFINGEKSKKARLIIEDAFLVDDTFRTKMNNSDYNEIVKSINIYTPMKNNKNIPIFCEVVDKNKVFSSKLTLNNMEIIELFAILQIFNLSYYDEIRIGSNKKRGCGLAKLKIKEFNLELKSNDIFTENELNEYFEINNDKSIKIKDKYLTTVYRLKNTAFNFENIEDENNKFLNCILGKVFTND